MLFLEFSGKVVGYGSKATRKRYWEVWPSLFVSKTCVSVHGLLRWKEQQGLQTYPRWHLGCCNESISFQVIRWAAVWWACAAPMDCWCYLQRQSSTWSSTRARWWTSWSSDGYDGCRRERASMHAHISLTVPCNMQRHSWFFWFG